MSYVLTLLFIAPFIDRKESRWFVSAYAFIILAANEMQVLLDLKESSVFLLFSYAQIFCMCLSIVLLEGRERILSTVLFLLFALYNVCIVLWWGSVSLLNYPFIVMCLILSQIMILTFKEKSLLKNISMFITASVIGFLTTRYI